MWDELFKGRVMCCHRLSGEIIQYRTCVRMYVWPGRCRDGMEHENAVTGCCGSFIRRHHYHHLVLVRRSVIRCDPRIAGCSALVRSGLTPAPSASPSCPAYPALSVLGRVG